MQEKRLNLIKCMCLRRPVLRQPKTRGWWFVCVCVCCKDSTSAPEGLSSDPIRSCCFLFFFFFLQNTTTSFYRIFCPFIASLPSHRVPDLPHTSFLADPIAIRSRSRTYIFDAQFYILMKYCDFILLTFFFCCNFEIELFLIKKLVFEIIK